jgi:hypothetical protein
LDKKRIRKLLDNPRFIPGIYNYCDRWCERCTFMMRCSNYALSEEPFSDAGDRDSRHERFWEKLGEVLQVTLDMLHDEAERRGLNLAAVDMAAVAEAEKEIEACASNHECTRSANAYSAQVEQWFDAAHAIFTEEARELELKFQLDLPDSNPVEEAAKLGDTVDVIRWYQDLISVKLQRAIASQVEETEDTGTEYPKDSDGSAKVALIGMDRSIAAWGTMLREFPSEENRILAILVHLQRLRRRTEEQFPAARSFVRPGFDEKPAASSMCDG